MSDQVAQNIGSTLSRMGWQQGVIADPATHGHFKEILAHAGRDDLVTLVDSTKVCFVAVSQTCDIVQFRDEAEPYVEFLLATWGEGAPNPADTYQKSFRTFAVELEGGNGHLRIKPWNRFLVPRGWVTQIPAFEVTIAPQRIRDLMDWLMTRYVRTALPDTFNGRLATVKAEDKMRKLLEKLPAVTEVFISLKPRYVELGQGEDYSCDLVLLCREDDFSNAGLREQMQPVLDEIEKFLVGIEGIEVEAVRLFGESQFTRHHMRAYDRWQFDDVSYAADARAAKKGVESGHAYRPEAGRTKP
ncbi:hypothetical protein [Paraburkholderia diazotrophica]|uniref:hypothetical protein n=1 Tax=Paraburkholderia diazotrophica TaxID=667676 RepID=UPI00317B94DA